MRDRGHRLTRWELMATAGAAGGAAALAVAERAAQPDDSKPAKGDESMRVRPVLAIALAALVIGSLTLATPGTASGTHVTQTVALNWHAQSGKSCPVGEGAQATLVRDRDAPSGQ